MVFRLPLDTPMHKGDGSSALDLATIMSFVLYMVCSLGLLEGFSLKQNKTLEAQNTKVSWWHGVECDMQADKAADSLLCFPLN